MTESSAGPKDEAGRFPKTRWTIIRNASDPGSPNCRESLGHLASLYWRPVYAHFRRKWGKSHEQASDLTQDFFTALCEKEFLSTLSPDQGRFRSYVMAALDNFAKLRHRSDGRLKRGGGAAHFSLEMGAGFEPAPDLPPEQIFLREWARSVMASALEELKWEYRHAGQDRDYEIFALRDVDPPGEEPPSYEDLAARFKVGVTDVTNILYRARKRLRALALNKVMDTVTTEEEAEAEMRALFEEGVSL